MHDESATPEPGSNGHDAGAAQATASRMLARLSREFHDVLADLEDLVRATTSLTGEDLARAKAQLGERIAAARRSAGELGGAIARHAGSTAAAADGFVHRQPWAAIGIGAAAGLLLGVALARRPHRIA